jgi:hypothetical protein
MALPNEQETLLAAWRALAGQSVPQGWRFIPITTRPHCLLRAGRRFPGNEEALAAGFHLTEAPAELPQGHGFTVLPVDMEATGMDRVWIGLVRQPVGNPELFTRMAADVIETMDGAVNLGEQALLRLFLDRIQAWQNFMRREREGLLSMEAEIGLHGELILLAMLLDNGLDAALAVEGWRGPLHGLHDFATAVGAIEVKTTAAEPPGFPVKIRSLEQLDSTLVSPLYLAGLHLSADPEGLNLAGRVAEVRRRLRNTSSVLQAFNTLLLQAGYADVMADRYPRCFSHDRTRLLQVDDSFPGLTRHKVASAITAVRYEIDLDCVEAEDLNLADILSLPGAP